MLPFAIIAGVAALIFGACGIFVLVEVYGKPKVTYEALKAKQQQLVEAAMRAPRTWEGEAEVRPFDDGEYTADELPDHHIVAWTPLEREIFGINDTQKWIEETDRILNRADLERRWAAAKQEVPDLSSMRVPGLPPAEDDEPSVAVFTWGSPEPIRTY